MDGLLTRGIDYWRSQPRCYMHSVLCDDCTGRGCRGGRDCKCCYNRIGRKFSVGYCTVECSCCEKAWDFKLAQKGNFHIKEDFNTGGSASL